LRNVWLLVSFFSLVVLSLGTALAWRITRIESGWDPQRAVIDETEFRREERSVEEMSQNAQPEWMQKLAALPSFTRLPAEENRVSIDLVDPSFRKNSVLVLRFKTPDRFEKICLDTFLETRGIEHTVKTGDSSYDVRLKTKERDYAERMIKELSTYDLAAELVVLYENKPY
jgi:hypothetical protein